MVGRRGLTRDVLLEIFRAAGARETRSYIATGNFAFNADAASLGEVVAGVETGIEAVLGHREELFIRTVDELRALDGAGFFSAASDDAPVVRGRCAPASTRSFAISPGCRSRWTRAHERADYWPRCDPRSER